MQLRQPDNLFRCSGNFPSHICDRPTLSLDRKLCNLPGELAASDSADIYRGYRFGVCVLFSPPFFFCDPQTATRDANNAYTPQNARRVFALMLNDDVVLSENTTRDKLALYTEIILSTRISSGRRAEIILQTLIRSR